MNLVAPGPGPAYPSHERAAAAAELETALYDRETCGKIIGPGGSTIKSIRESTGAKVVVSNESVCGMQVVSLSGSEAQIHAAKLCLAAIATSVTGGGSLPGSTARSKAEPPRAGAAEPPGGGQQQLVPGSAAVAVTEMFAKSQVSRLIGPGARSPGGTAAGSSLVLTAPTPRQAARPSGGCATPPAPSSRSTTRTCPRRPARASRASSCA